MSDGMSIKARINFIFGIESLFPDGRFEAVNPPDTDTMRYRERLEDILKKEDIEKLDERMRDMADVRDWYFDGSFGSMVLVIDIGGEAEGEDFTGFSINMDIVPGSFDLGKMTAEELREYAVISDREEVKAEADSSEMLYIMRLLQGITDRDELAALLEGWLDGIAVSKMCAEDFFVKDGNGREICILDGIRRDWEE